MAPAIPIPTAAVCWLTPPVLALEELPPLLPLPEPLLPLPLPEPLPPVLLEPEPEDVRAGVDAPDMPVPMPATPIPAVPLVP